MLSDNENGHSDHSRFFELADEFGQLVFTLTPPERFAAQRFSPLAGAAWCSTPRSAGVFTSIGFFFAFMMFGSDA